MEIIQFIPHGKENAVTREELKLLTGLSDRDIRELITQARRTHCIINDQDGKGYYQPTKIERPAVEKWLKQESSRAKTVFWAAKGAREFLRRC